MERVLTFVITLVASFATVFVLWAYPPSITLICGGLVVAVFIMGSQVEKLQKTVAEQQTQIADLKRELEEGKGKE